MKKRYLSKAPTLTRAWALASVMAWRILSLPMPVSMKTADMPDARMPSNKAYRSGDSGAIKITRSPRPNPCFSRPAMAWDIRWPSSP